MATANTGGGNLPRLLSAKQLHGIIGAGRSWGAFRIYLWRLARRGELVPVKTGAHGVAWREDEVRAWLDTRPRGAHGAGEVAA